MTIMLAVCGAGMLVSAFVFVIEGGIAFGIFQAISGVLLLYAICKTFYGG